MIPGSAALSAGKILVLWADERSANLGVRALAAGAREVATRALSPREVVFQDFGPDEQGFHPGKREVLADVLRPGGPIKTWLGRHDAILDTGAGDSLTDGYGARRLLMMLYTQRAAIQLGIPLVFLPQTIGPFRSPPLRALAAATLRAARTVFARDPESERYARERLGVDALPGTDLVFALPRPTTPPSGAVVLNVSGLLWDRNPHVDDRRYRDQLRRLAGALRADGHRIVLMPHVLANASPDDDQRVLHHAAELLGADSIAVPTDLGDARRILAGASAVVGSRMHACLNALSMGTPSYAWAYSRKFAPLLESLGWPWAADIRTSGDLVPGTVEFVRAAAAGELDEAVHRSIDEADARLAGVTEAIRAAWGALA